jgi:hypothetical protein
VVWILRQFGVGGIKMESKVWYNVIIIIMSIILIAHVAVKVLYLFGILG